MVLLPIPSLRQNYYVSMGALVFSITEDGEDKLNGLVTISQKGAAKIQPGDEVRIKLDAYPYLEYGALIGKIKHVSKMTDDQSFKAIVEFPHGLVTNYNQRIDYLPDMAGHSEIIIQKENLLDNILRVLKWNKKVYFDS